jgi:hypothetical protein
MKRVAEADNEKAYSWCMIFSENRFPRFGIMHVKGLARDRDRHVDLRLVQTT